MINELTNLQLLKIVIPVPRHIFYIGFFEQFKKSHNKVNYQLIHEKSKKINKISLFYWHYPNKELVKFLNHKVITNFEINISILLDDNSNSKQQLILIQKLIQSTNLIIKFHIACCHETKIKNEAFIVMIKKLINQQKFCNVIYKFRKILCKCQNNDTDVIPHAFYYNEEFFDDIQNTRIQSNSYVYRLGLFIIYNIDIY